MVDIYQLLDLAAVQVPALYPNCILLQVCAFPSPAVRDARTLCRSARLHPLMIWNAYCAGCIIWKCFLKISDNSYYTRLYCNTCIQCLLPRPGAVRKPAGRGLWCFALSVSGLWGFFLFLWARSPACGLVQACGLERIGKRKRTPHPTPVAEK